MRSVCAWCEEDGIPPELGERAPLDDSSTTHGICSRHFTQLLAVLRTVSHVTQGGPSEADAGSEGPRW